MRIEVVYALAGEQELVVLRLPAGTSAGDAVAASGLGAAGCRLGIGGREVTAAEILRDGDRVELLRPLALDPREARRRRARARGR
ncbi:MAG: RnfH family protein [Burkholderiales bacterium]|nr:RnfH family protein [Burkholderiales bacterium]